ncbi:MAG: hypothetical protein AAF756_03530 [Pseudomonadota bacterium]
MQRTYVLVQPQVYVDEYFRDEQGRLGRTQGWYDQGDYQIDYDVEIGEAEQIGEARWTTGIESSPDGIPTITYDTTVP